MSKLPFIKTDIFEEYFKAQLELEEKYGSQSIVLMMVGSFYEIYQVDLPNVRIGKAEDANDILGMNMTKKNKSKAHARNNPYMVGFPDYAIDEHLGKLLRKNFTVATFDQYDQAYTDQNGKQRQRKIRKCSHVYTPSTFVDDTLTDENSLLVLELTEYKSPITKQIMKKIHIAILSLSTGRAHLLESYDNQHDTGKAECDLYRILHSYNPSEIIYCGSNNEDFAKSYDMLGKKIYFREIPKKYRSPEYQNEFLSKIYDLKTLLTPIEFIGMEKHSSVLPHFIQALQFAFEQDKLIVSRIHKPEFIEENEQMILNNDSIYQLNLVTSPFEVTHTLYDIICKAKTAMGKRRIRQSLLSPTRNIQELQKSYDLIEKMQPVYVEYGSLLRGIADLEKKYRKMVLHTLNPYELADLCGTFRNIRKLLRKSRDLFDIPNDLLDDYKCFYNEYMGNFDFEVMKRCKLRDIKGSFFARGVNKVIDELSNKTEGNNILQQIAVDFSSIVEPEKNNTVKLERNAVEGYFLKMTSRRFKMLPKDISVHFDYHGKHYHITRDDLEVVHLKDTVKVRSPQIRIVSNNVLTRQERINDLVSIEYIKILDHYVHDYGDLFIKIAEIIAHIDFIYSASKVSIENGYVRPQIDDSQNGTSYLQIDGLRHPIIEKINDTEEYITNDITIGVNEHYGSVMYGLNLAGKSSTLKAIGCNVVMAQAGMFASCTKFVYYPFQYLLSKMSIRDNISKGQSTFMLEMLEVKNMLMRANANSLVLSDELCSSTESTSGHAIVAQTLQSLTELKVKFMFSTHLHELQKIPLVIENKHIKIFHFKVRIDGNKIVFDRKIEQGGMTDLYGLEVARALGLPEEFMRGAFIVRDYLTKQQSEILSTKSSRYNSKLSVHECAECGATENLHTHHLKPQKDADEYGLIDRKFHKNRKFNLRVLCEDCHKKIHIKK
jgi:DNA mismatch repair protein MutS